MRTVIDININETITSTIDSKEKIAITLLSVKEKHDSIRNAVRQAELELLINDEYVTIYMGNYHLPRKCKSAIIDCPVVKNIGVNTQWMSIDLLKDARLRIWSLQEAPIPSLNLKYPVKQRWFSGRTQMSNEPAWTGGEGLKGGIYYHKGIDFGAYKAVTPVVSTCNGIVCYTKGLKDNDNHPIVFWGGGKNDEIFIKDERGWYHHYMHLSSLSVNVGDKVESGQFLGFADTTGTSGGWSHLHYEILAPQPTGKWDIEDSYVYLVEAYKREHSPALLAVARPHNFVRVNETVTLDATRSCIFHGEKVKYTWEIHNGAVITNPIHEITYSNPGVYSEMLKVENEFGESDHDFMVSIVIGERDEYPPMLNAIYEPTQNILVGQEVCFSWRDFGYRGKVEWDFGDGTKIIETTIESTSYVDSYKSSISHTYTKPGIYIAQVRCLESEYESGQKFCIEVNR